MKHSLLIFLVFFMHITSRAGAQELLLDSGPINSWDGSLTLADNVWHANQFSVSTSTKVTSVEGYVYRAENPGSARNGELKATIYSTGEDGLPRDRLFEAPFFVPNTQSMLDPDWHGAFGLDWMIPPGDYWAAFVSDDDNPFGGGMPYEVSEDSIRAVWIEGPPDPSFPPGWELRSGRKLGFRVSGTVVPEPSGLSMSYLLWPTLLLVRKRTSWRHRSTD